MSHFLTILEVSQKQAYIFSSNMLKDNVVNSAVIAWIMSPKYFSEVIGDRNIFDEEKTLFTLEEDMLYLSLQIEILQKIL